MTSSSSSGIFRSDHRIFYAALIGFLETGRELDEEGKDEVYREFISVRTVG
jgi:hypothetical protein